MKNDAFEQSEISGRAKADIVLNSLESIFDDGYVDYRLVHTHSSCQWDYEIRDLRDNQLIGIIEAKDRKFPSNDRRLIRQGAQLEEYKYNALLNICEKLYIPAFFLCTFTDNKYYIWDIEKSNVTDDVRMCNKTTAVLTEKVEKHCYYFKLADAEFKGTFSTSL